MAEHVSKVTQELGMHVISWPKEVGCRTRIRNQKEIASTQGENEGDTQRDPQPPVADAELQEIIGRWPHLANEAKQAVVILVRSATDHPNK